MHNRAVAPLNQTKFASSRLSLHGTQALV